MIQSVQSPFPTSSVPGTAKVPDGHEIRSIGMPRLGLGRPHMGNMSVAKETHANRPRFFSSLKSFLHPSVVRYWQAVTPPSTKMFCPVTNEELGEARNTAIPAKSSVSPTLPMGMRLTRAL